MDFTFPTPGDLNSVEKSTLCLRASGDLSEDESLGYIIQYITSTSGLGGGCRIRLQSSIRALFQTRVDLFVVVGPPVGPDGWAPRGMSQSMTNFGGGW